MLRDHSNKWKQKYTSFWWKPLGTNHKMPHSFTLIVFLCENELFQRGWGVSVTLVEIPKGWGVISSLQKWKIQGGGGVLSEIPSVVGVWIFSGTTQWVLINLTTILLHHKVKQNYGRITFLFMVLGLANLCNLILLTGCLKKFVVVCFVCVEKFQHLHSSVNCGMQRK